MFLHQLGAVIVAGSHILSAGLRAAIKHVAQLSHGQDCDTDAEFVHLLQSLFRSPRPSAPDVAEAWRLMVMMDIDGAATNIQPVDLVLSKSCLAAQNG